MPLTSVQNKWWIQYVMTHILNTFSKVYESQNLNLCIHLFNFKTLMIKKWGHFIIKFKMPTSMNTATLYSKKTIMLPRWPLPKNKHDKPRRKRRHKHPTEFIQGRKGHFEAMVWTGNSYINKLVWAETWQK